MRISDWSSDVCSSDLDLSVSTPAGATALAHRGVPDVAGDADPVTGYRVRIDGVDREVGGTSAVAPMWAALIARLNTSRGAGDRKSVVSGKSVSARVDLGGSSIIKKKRISEHTI